MSNFFSFLQFFESASYSSKLDILKDHFDRTNIDLANWIVKNLGTSNIKNPTEKQAIKIIKQVDSKEYWPKLPSMYFFDSPAEDVPEGTVLIHFTRNPENISANGFKKGEPDYLKLGMNWGSKSQEITSGYNYAFVPDDVIEKYGSLEKAFNHWRLSGGIVFFKAPAIKCYHFGDDVEQVIFWGDDTYDIDMIVKKKDRWIFGEQEFESLDKAFKKITSHV